MERVTEMLDWKSVGSLLATFMFLRTAIRDFLPPEVSQFLKRLFRRLLGILHPNVSILVEEYDSSYNNELYEAVQAYLGTRCFSSAQILKMSKPQNSRNLSFAMDANQKLEDTFKGFKIKWTFNTVEKKSTNPWGYSRSHEIRYFELSFHRKYKDQVHDHYLPHILKEAEEIKFKNRERRLYTNKSGGDSDGHRHWSSVTFSHPASFDTLAIDPVLKRDIKEDLNKFIKSREFYNRVGRAWKRGYLLYGPPGTGKTSLIAAIANYLEFDIYDLELTAVKDNSQLRKLLITTSSKSIIVIEDVDCTLDLSDRKKKAKKDVEPEDGEKKKEEKKDNDSSLSLSGVLNFVDGLWSSCGSEKLMIFTTNYKDKLDPALLRAGRMDKHIHLSFCGFMAFKTLARNYLYLEDEHELMEEVEQVLPLVQITPADVAEVFMSYAGDTELALSSVVTEMKRRLDLSASVAEIETTEKETGEEDNKNE